MKTIMILALGSLVLLGTGCAPTITKEEFAPKMYTEHPLSLLVLPPINKSTAADAKEYYIATIAEPFTNWGYYVFPMEVVGDILKQEGLFDTETMMNVPPQKFKEYFGADAVLYVTILKWNTSYLVIAGNVTVKLSCELRSTITGEVLWFYDDEFTVDTSGDSGGAGGLAGLIVKAVSTAIETAATDYVPVAQKVNDKLVHAMPHGKYHARYLKDMDVKIEMKKNINGEEEKKQPEQK